MFADTHTHLLDARFDKDREDIISGFDDNGVCFIIENGTNERGSFAAAGLASSCEKVYAAVGVHPQCASEFNSDTKSVIESIIKSNDKVVAIGEIGLDYHYDFSPKNMQRDVFVRQLAFAEKMDMPIVVHSRDAAADTFDILKDFNVRGELHCFSGSAEMAEKYVECGFYIGFGGAVTFKNANRLLKAVDAVPAERMLTETDCPYMTPVPHRGHRNEPAYVRYVIEKIAEIKNLCYEDVECRTLENAKILFGIGRNG